MGPTQTPAGESRESITDGLAALRGGDQAALSRLVPLLYDDLRRIAQQRLRSERDGHTLGATALVHEAYLRLAGHRRLSVADRSEFFAAASNTMRRILVDYARTRLSSKRGAGVVAVPLDEVEPFLTDRAADETLALDQALARLDLANPRAARVFEQRLFGGLSLEEIADGLGVSTKTVHRDWQAARSWLRKEVGSSLASAGSCIRPLA